MTRSLTTSVRRESALISGPAVATIGDVSGMFISFTIARIFCF